MDKQIGDYTTLQFMTEKKEGHGEDAQPLLVIKDKLVAVGVFDGMGGAGAATCMSEYGENYTKAYVASRIVRNEVEALLEDSLGKEDISSELLKVRISQRLKQEQEAYPLKTKSMLRSKLVRDYPTTMAVVILCQTETEIQIDSFWAGDSHCYLWTNKGFFQISKDDLEEDNDPMENLRNDAAISNCICADRDFQINHRHIVLSKEPMVILSASDGCFGYFPTPMHFEDMLKRCLRQAKDEEDWEKRIIKHIQEVTGDDTSLSLIGVGFDSFDKLKKIMSSSLIPVVKKLKSMEKGIDAKKQKLTEMQDKYEQTIKSGWKDYKQKYMKYINEDSDA